jgi:2-isopropylmalate synthase
MATRGTELVMKYAEQYLGDTEFGYQYSPEIFTQTPTDFAVEVCNRVADVWQPDEGREIIFNLPATVEMSTPNTYADQIEYFIRTSATARTSRLAAPPQRPRHRRRGHRAGPDGRRGPRRGLPVRARRAHRQRRPGHLGLNLFSQGIDPQIDFSDIDEVRRTVEYCTGLPVHPRHPYAGDLVYTAFSGSHQDAIKKGLEALEKQADAEGAASTTSHWEAPYLPIDPHDVGRTYEAVIRVNSQSGKGGMAYIMKNDHKMDLPRRLQIEFSRVVQQHTDAAGGEVGTEQMWEIFEAEYFGDHTPLELVQYKLTAEDGVYTVDAALKVNGADARSEARATALCPRSWTPSPRPASRSGCSTTPSTPSAPAGTPWRPPTWSARSARATTPHLRAGAADHLPRAVGRRPGEVQINRGFRVEFNSALAPTRAVCGSTPRSTSASSSSSASSRSSRTR